MAQLCAYKDKGSLDVSLIPSIADFKKFLDFYMKGQNNGWEDTPKVRASVIRYNEVSLCAPKAHEI